MIKFFGVLVDGKFYYWCVRKKKIEDIVLGFCVNCNLEFFVLVMVYVFFKKGKYRLEWVRNKEVSEGLKLIFMGTSIGLDMLGLEKFLVEMFF